MKTFTKQFAQGDVYFERVAEIPTTAKAVEGKIVTHSESGHHHAFPTDANIQRYTTDNPFVCYLSVAGTGAELLHNKTGPHAHESVFFEPGCYKISRQRETAPEGYRQVAD